MSNIRKESSLDPTDLRLLDHLQTDARITNVALAESASLSPAPCLRRVRDLEAAGVIRGYATLLDPVELARIEPDVVVMQRRVSEADIAEIIPQLRGIGGSQPVWDEDGVILSLPDAIGRCLERAMGAPVGVPSRDMCPGCGAVLVREEGCMKCFSCGYAKC